MQKDSAADVCFVLVFTEESEQSRGILRLNLQEAHPFVSSNHGANVTFRGLMAEKGHNSQNVHWGYTLSGHEIMLSDKR